MPQVPCRNNELLCSHVQQQFLVVTAKTGGKMSWSALKSQIQKRKVELQQDGKRKWKRLGDEWKENSTQEKIIEEHSPHEQPPQPTDTITTTTTPPKEPPIPKNEVKAYEWI